MNSVGEAFGWAFRDPSWPGKMVVQALILIIPIVGWIATAGWGMMAFENARNGRNELPPAGFHLERGIAIFGVWFIYFIVLNIPAWILDAIGGATSSAIRNGTNSYTYYYSSPFRGLGSLWSFLVGLLLDFLLPSLIVMTFHSGFAGGLDVARVWRYATSHLNISIIGGLIVFVAGIIAFLGFIACCVGFFFTAVYAFTINAGVAAWFERMQSAQAPPPGAPTA